MTEIVIALVMQFGILRADGVIMVNNNGVNQIKQQTGVDLKLIESDGHYRVLPSAVGVGILDQDQNGRKP